MSIEIAQTLDARGLNCPLPILRTKKAIAALQQGEILEMTSTDPGSLKDIESFCTQTGNELLGSSQSDGDYIFQIRKQ
ncbi:MAG: sulfurtransferase TusA family protein [Gammaproteobacteria bacterium]|jgi:tRNA 2-thiouridine synthesizing protein A|nr:sulfurtransferase TusA family protein [Gammaproteobacteria bacterium]MBT3723584.1 sulfurtransferase TusA family protein [Gammaproteobacteria bacterium]MBT4078476.1 sulfurtransferase TusA family protein [Gammaproteobacteria bacterium]MBT4192840.1 sulfurtransferase TusA family protein [Gammaproteobacteria bacterium]MBT4452299.1 sulfurtransferase TusA family protein [Gammaproteobacteria bacterium]